jgi:hypothetical protein
MSSGVGNKQSHSKIGMARIGKPLSYSKAACLGLESVFTFGNQAVGNLTT